MTTTTTEAFEAKKPKKIEPGSELHFALLATPMGWNFLTGKDYADMQAFAKAVWDAATERAAKTCLALKPPDLDHAPGEYHRFDVTTLACAAAIRASSGKGEA